MRTWFIRLGLTAAGVAAAVALSPLSAQKKYDSGASDTEIKVGHLGPYSGPASAYGRIGHALKAYFDKVNADGGINGRRINFVTLDDGYNPAKAVEQARKLVEQEEVLLLFNSLGTPSNTAIHKYMNQKKVPQLFVATGATKWGDSKNFPWTMGWQPSYQSEAKVYARHLLETRPDARVGILYQNDDYGKDYLEGFEAGLGDKARTMIVSKVTYEVTDPTIDSQMVTLKSSGADVFLNITTPKFAAQAIKKAAELGWKPVHYLNNVSTSVAAVMVPAGTEAGVGVISAFYLWDPADPDIHQTKGYQDYAAWMDKYNPAADKKDGYNVYGYAVAQTLVQVLKQAGDELTRANVMKQAASLDMTSPMLLDGIDIKTGANDFYPIERQQLRRFNGRNWESLGKTY
jgi:branched-chain amino acid transport system substrate-binding protein